MPVMDEPDEVSDDLVLEFNWDPVFVDSGVLHGGGAAADGAAAPELVAAAKPAAAVAAAKPAAHPAAPQRLAGAAKPAAKLAAPQQPVRAAKPAAMPAAPQPPIRAAKPAAHPPAPQLLAAAAKPAAVALAPVGAAPVPAAAGALSTLDDAVAVVTHELQQRGPLPLARLCNLTLWSERHRHHGRLGALILTDARFEYDAQGNVALVDLDGLERFVDHDADAEVEAPAPVQAAEQDALQTALDFVRDNIRAAQTNKASGCYLCKSDDGVRVLTGDLHALRQCLIDAHDGVFDSTFLEGLELPHCHWASIHVTQLREVVRAVHWKPVALIRPAAGAPFVVSSANVRVPLDWYPVVLRDSDGDVTELLRETYGTAADWVPILLGEVWGLRPRRYVFVLGPTSPILLFLKRVMCPQAVQYVYRVDTSICPSTLLAVVDGGGWPRAQQSANATIVVTNKLATVTESAGLSSVMIGNGKSRSPLTVCDALCAAGRTLWRDAASLVEPDASHPNAPGGTAITEYRARSGPLRLMDRFCDKLQVQAVPQRDRNRPFDVLEAAWNPFWHLHRKEIPPTKSFVSDNNFEAWLFICRGHGPYSYSYTKLLEVVRAAEATGYTVPPILQQLYPKPAANEAPKRPTDRDNDPRGPATSALGPSAGPPAPSSRRQATSVRQGPHASDARVSSASARGPPAPSTRGPSASARGSPAPAARGPPASVRGPAAPGARAPVPPAAATRGPPASARGPPAPTAHRPPAHAGAIPSANTRGPPAPAARGPPASVRGPAAPGARAPVPPAAATRGPPASARGPPAPTEHRPPAHAGAILSSAAPPRDAPAAATDPFVDNTPRQKRQRTG